jgi:hypothetical protein
MREAHLKSLVTSGLACELEPDLSRLDTLRDATDAQHRKLLRWLDESGLALYFLDHLQQHNAADRLPNNLRHALETRLTANRHRTANMFEEFRRVTNSFKAVGVIFAAIKGLSLTPDFCPAQHLRHQADFDFLVSPHSIPQATRALESHGYVQEEVKPSGEITFSTPQTHVPSAYDDIYAPPRHREIDLLPSLHLDFHGVSISTPTDQLARARSKTIDDLNFPALAADDMFALQILHSFSHLLGSWVRLSWLLEISNFLHAHHQNDSLWHSVIERQQNAPSQSSARSAHTRNAFGLILSLTQEIFPSSRPLPLPLHKWCIEPLPAPVHAWMHHFGRRFAHADLNGSKLSLFVHREFMRDSSLDRGAPTTAADRRAFNRYALRRIFPVGHRSSLGKVSITSPRAKLRVNALQRLHSMQRVLFHFREMVSFPVEAIRWKLALRAFDRQRARTFSQSDSTRANSGTSAGNTLGNLAQSPD